VTIGAHPGYPDREGFGRRELDLSLDEVAASFEAQIERMAETCSLEGAALRYVKPHGALYNRAARDESLANRLAESVKNVDASLMMLGLSASVLESACRAAGVRFAREAFIDRGYTSRGSLVPRENDGALIEDPEFASRRAVTIARGEAITAVDGNALTLVADSLCVHGDGAKALATVTASRHALERDGFTIAAFAK
jgi:UPF0271 protein